MNRALPTGMFMAITGVLAGAVMGLLYLFVWQETPERALIRGLETGAAAIAGMFVSAQLARKSGLQPFGRVASRKVLVALLVVSLLVALAIVAALVALARR